MSRSEVVGVTGGNPFSHYVVKSFLIYHHSLTPVEIFLFHPIEFGMIPRSHTDLG